MNFENLCPFYEEKIESNSYKFRLHKKSPWFIFDKEYVEILYKLDMIYVPYEGLIVRDNGFRLSDAVLEITNIYERAIHLKNNFIDYRKVNLLKKPTPFVEKYAGHKDPLDHFRGNDRSNTLATIKSKQKKIRQIRSKNDYHFNKTNPRYYKENSIIRNWRDPNFRKHTFKTHQYFIFDKDLSGRFEGVHRVRQKNRRGNMSDMFITSISIENKRMPTRCAFGLKFTEKQALIKAIRWRLSKMKNFGLEFTTPTLKWPEIMKMCDEHLSEFLSKAKEYEFRNNPSFEEKVGIFEDPLKIPYPLKNKSFQSEN
jgi:hypothetical protein